MDSRTSHSIVLGQMFWLYATLKTRGKLGRVNFRKDFWDCYWRVPSNDPRNHCGTCFGSSSLLVLILLISSSVYTIVFATLKIRGKLGRVNFRKDFWDCYWQVPSNHPTNNCGTHVSSSSLLVSKVPISNSVYTIGLGSDMKRLFCSYVDRILLRFSKTRRL